MNFSNLQHLVITRETRKTGARVEIPIMPPLAELLRDNLALVSNSEYIFPEHAEMYLKNRTGVSYRVNKFLESVGIERTRVPKGRSRAISVKDLHSCRHTFCYLAGVNNIPISETVFREFSVICPEIPLKFSVNFPYFMSRKTQKNTK